MSYFRPATMVAVLKLSHRDLVTINALIATVKLRQLVAIYVDGDESPDEHFHLL